MVLIVPFCERNFFIKEGILYTSMGCITTISHFNYFYISHLEHCWNKPSALGQRDAQKKTFSNSTSTGRNRLLKVLVFLSSHIDHIMEKEQKSPHLFKISIPNSQPILQYLIKRNPPILSDATHSLPLILNNYHHNSLAILQWRNTIIIFSILET